MPIKIHHGPPGSYKTSGALGDDFLREARAGRVIVTNVRGLSRARALEVFDDLPETFDVIWVDDRTNEGRDKLGRWFHWAPKGAFLFIDEAQMIFPRHWRDADLHLLAYPGGREKAAADDRPADWWEAWDKHRHWNWDVVLTTPSIKKLRDDIRGASEMAYKHKNLATVGIKGRYVEAAHMPDDSGDSNHQVMNLVTKKVPDYVFKLYDSTATGAVSDTKAGFSFLKNPRVLMLLGILGFSLWFSLGRDAGPGSAFLGGADSKDGSKGSPVSGANGSSPGGSNGGHVAAVPGNAPPPPIKPARFPHEDGRYSEITAATDAPYPTVCVSLDGKCQCYMVWGVPLALADDVCHEVLKNGFVPDWKGVKGAAT